MINILIICRVHYTIDIIGGLVFAAFYHKLSTIIVKYYDKVLSLPFVFVFYVTKIIRVQQ